MFVKGKQNYPGTRLKNDNNPEYETTGGVPTIDKVFPLTINEANTLFTNVLARANDSWWWLRSPSLKSCDAVCVYEDGKVLTHGYNVRNSLGVRFALWLKLNS